MTSRLKPFSFLYFVLKRPTVFFLALYAALIPFSNVLGIGKWGSVTRYLGIIVIIVTWIELLAKGRGRILKPPSVALGWLIFLELAGGSALWAVSPSTTISSMFTIVGLFLIYLSVGVYPFTARDYSYITKNIIVGGNIAALASFFGYLNRLTYKNTVRGSLVFGEGRWADPNHFATSLILPLMFSIEWTFSASRGRKIRGLLSAIVIGIAILLTGSRGGFLGVAVATLLFFWRVRSKIQMRTIVKTITFVFIIVLVVVVYVAPPASLFDRFSLSIVLSSGGAGRFTIWQIGWRAFLHRPMIGYGYNNFAYVYDLFRGQFLSGGYYFTLTHRPAHNIYLQTFTELGLVGGLLLLFIIWKHWQLVRRLEQRNSLFITLEAAFVGIMVTSTTLGTLNYKYFWLVFSLILLSANIIRTKKEAKYD
jgi:O-antigen ligase